jgi:hypothetical protein
MIFLKAYFQKLARNHNRARRECQETPTWLIGHKTMVAPLDKKTRWSISTYLILAVILIVAAIGGIILEHTEGLRLQKIDAYKLGYTDGWNNGQANCGLSSFPSLNITFLNSTP